MIKRLQICHNFIIICLFVCLPGLPAYTQVTRAGKPYPLEYENCPALRVYESKIAREQIAESIEIETTLLKPAKSGLLLNVNYSPENDGVWDTLPDGNRIWRMAIYVEEATLLNIVFNHFNLFKGVKIFIYDMDQQHIAGAFTDLNNKQSGILATVHIPGNYLVIEMQVPIYLQSYGMLGVAGIGCDFSGNLKSIQDEWFNQSGDCNIDINCEKDEIFQTLKRSVVRIVYLGNERCTGTLLNTTLNHNPNYILTAGHCFTKESHANTAVFYFDYESPVCNGPDGNTSRSVSGATIRAASDDLDFALLELLEPVPFYYHPYYAGWDYTGVSPSSATAIHHPWGDVKKISRDDHAPVVRSYPDDYDRNTHWLVRHWEGGTTEPGSSGAPLFNDAGSLIGTLTGGLATCTNPVNDYFQMFSHSWNDYITIENHLSSWLDPFQKSGGMLGGRDPYSEFWTTLDTLQNIKPGEVLDFGTGYTDWGSLAGHNSYLTEAFAEKYSTTVNKKILGVILDVEKIHAASALSEIAINVWNSNEMPGNAIYRKSIYLADLVQDTLNFVQFDSIVTVGRDFFIGYELNYGLPQDTFAVSMVQNRFPDTFETAYIYDGSHWNSLYDYTGRTVTSSYAIFPVVFESFPDSDYSEYGKLVSIYPNPANSVLLVSFNKIEPAAVTITLVNMQGQIVFKDSYGSYQHIIPVDLLNISRGIYILKIEQGHRIYNHKVSVIK